ncbi:MAG: hypothetical protein ACR2ND_09030 [Solirubrobacteraceae bacterium]
MEQPLANLPEPRADRAVLAAAFGVLALGAVIIAFALAGGSGTDRAQAPAIPLATPTPTPTPAAAGAAPLQSRRAASIVEQRPATVQRRDAARFTARPRTHIAARWVAGFYRAYAVAARTFNVNWLLLASIHAQETAFSTAPSTYQGLNFAGCCGGPMQFNIANGPPSTWDRVKDSYRYGRRPPYVHISSVHPSIYDDFDAIMAAARLLAADGAGSTLDASAWSAAYSYYGHDPTGITYADQVLSRAIGWSQHAFCINCGLDTRILGAVHAAYGAPTAAPARPAAVKRGRR